MCILNSQLVVCGVCVCLCVCERLFIWICLSEPTRASVPLLYSVLLFAMCVCDFVNVYMRVCACVFTHVSVCIYGACVHAELFFAVCGVMCVWEHACASVVLLFVCSSDGFRSLSLSACVTDVSSLHT